MGAAGRDFHNFNMFFRNNAEYHVVAFTASQIPNIADRCYPPSLSGSLYPEGIPIRPEEELPSLIREQNIDVVILAYSDLSHEEVMHKASKVIANGPDFILLGPKSTMLKSRLPVVAITATRTGAGKSTVTRYVASLLRAMGRKPVIIRHPMPYGVLEKQTVQRFSALEDLARHECTIEEREEYEPHIRAGYVVYAGVDYQRILEEAEAEGDIILWDGGNNDFPFIAPNLHITVADAYRPGQENTYHPGEVNLLTADIVVINKVGEETMVNVEKIRQTVARENPKAKIMTAGSRILVEGLEEVKGKTVVVVEDGPTVTHGGMSHGLGLTAAMRGGADIADPRPYAVGHIKRAYEEYTHIGPVVPALGYGVEQVKDLESTIRNIHCDAIMSATPIDLSLLIRVDKPIFHVRYELDDFGQSTIRDALRNLRVV